MLRRTLVVLLGSAFDRHAPAGQRSERRLILYAVRSMRLHQPRGQ
jgi:hypothetical protein